MFIPASEDILRLQITAGFQETMNRPSLLNSTEIIPWAQVALYYSIHQVIF